MECFSKPSRQRHQRSIAERTEEDAANQQPILAHVREHPAQRRAAVRGVGPLDGKFGCGHGRRRVRGIGHGAGKSIQRGAEYSMLKAGRERDAGILVCSQHSGWVLRCSKLAKKSLNPTVFGHWRQVAKWSIFALTATHRSGTI